MRAAYLVQAVGTTVVASTFIAPEIVARLLASYPSSEIVWYIHLGILRPLILFRTSSLVTESVLAENSVFLGGLVIAAAWAACILRQRLILGLFANFSMLLVCSLAFLCAAQSKPSDAVSLNWIAPSPSGPDFMLLLMLVLVSATAFLACHAAFIRDIFARKS